MAGSKKISAQMSTSVALDTLKAAESLQSLRKAVTGTTNAWKAQATALETAGNAQEALRAKINGLKETQEIESRQIEVLKQKQKDLDVTTEKGAQQYAKYQSQIDRLNATYEKQNAQIDKTKQSLNYYESGLNKLQDSYRQSNQLSQSLVERLRAEGKEWQANQEEIKQAKNAYNNLKQQYDVQENELGTLKDKLEAVVREYKESQRELNEIAQTSGKASSAYREQKQKMDGLHDSIDKVNSELNKQQTRLNKTATDMVKAKNKANDLNTEYKKVPRSVTTEVKAKTEKATSGIKTFTSAIKGSAIGAGIANVAMAGLNAVGDNLNASFERYDTLKNFPKVLQSMGASADDSKKAMATLKQGVDGLPTSLQDVAQASEKLLPMSKNADDAAKSALALNDAFLASHASSEDASRGLQQYTQMLNSGKVDLQSWKTLQETMPASLQKVAKSFGIASGSTQELYQKMKSGEITMDQLNAKFQELDKGANGFHQQAKQATDGIGTAMSNLKNRSVAALTDIVGGFDKLSQNLTGSSIGGNINKLSAGFKDFGEKAGKAIGDLAPTIKKLTPLFNSMKQVGEAALSGLKPIISAVKDEFGKLSKSTGSLKKVLDTLRPVIKVISDVIGNVLGTAIRIAVDLVVDLVKWFNSCVKAGESLGKGIKKMVSNIKGSFNDFKNACGKLGDKFSDMVSSIKDKATNMRDDVAAKMRDLGNKAKSSFEDMKEKTKAKFEDMKESVKGKAENLKSNVSDKFNNLSDNVKSTTENMKEKVKGKFDDLYENVKGKTETFKSKIGEKWSNMWDNLSKGAQNATKSVGNAVVDMMNNVIKSINGMIKGAQKGVNWVLDKFGADKVSFGTIDTLPKFAKGGTVGKGTMALVNDAPGKNYREMFATPDGRVGAFPQQRNFMTFLPEGTQVLDGENSKALAEMMGIPAFKDGTDNKNMFEKMFDKAWDVMKDIGNIIAHPIKFLEKTFTKYITKGNDTVGKFMTSVIGKAPSFFAKQGGNWLKKIAEDFKKKKEEESSVAGISAKNIGKGAGNWRSVIEKVAKATHTNVSESDMLALLARIQKESGGDQSIRQKVWDVNMANGNPAQGLFQYIPPTFAAWAVPGHTNILSGEDQIYAVFNDSNWRSDIRMPGGWGPTGHKMFANGGFVNTATQAIIGEAGPEVVIPFNRPNRALELLTQSVNRLNRQAGNKTVVTTDNGSLESKLDTMIGLLSQLIGINSNGFAKSNSKININNLYQKMGRDQSINDYQAY